MSTTLFVGNLPWETEEAELSTLFSSCGSVVKCEIPKGRQGRSRGYGVVQFSGAQEAALAISQLNGHAIGERQITVREDKEPPAKAAPPAREPRERKPAGERKVANNGAPAAGDGCRVYVGNLAWETTEEEVTAHFAGAGTITHAEVARQSSGRSKGWALVDFATPGEAAAAIASLHDTDLRGRSIIVRLERAGEKPLKAERPPRAERAARPERGPAPERPENSSGRQVVVRNLPWTTSSEDLRDVFQQVGTVVSATAVCHEDTGRSKGWGTVLFATAEEAQAAIAGFNGVELEGRMMNIRMDRYE